MEEHRAELAQMQRDARAHLKELRATRGAGAAVAVTERMTARAASRSRLRVALFGTPAFALPTLEALVARHDVRPGGRAARPARRPRPRSAAPPVAERARSSRLPLAQPERLRRDAAFAERLAALDLDVAVTAAYGQILPASLLDVPREGFLNVHASLLPRWRGAAPVQHALIAGDDGHRRQHHADRGRASTPGPCGSCASWPIAPTRTTPALLDALADLGAEALLEALERWPRACRASAAGRRAGHAGAAADRTTAASAGPSRAPRRDRHRGVAGWPGSWCRVGGRGGPEGPRPGAARRGAPGACAPARCSPSTPTASWSPAGGRCA
jgi:methionyl-tRNA formyltransferase